MELRWRSVCLVAATKRDPPNAAGKVSEYGLVATVAQRTLQHNGDMQASRSLALSQHQQKEKRPMIAAPQHIHLVGVRPIRKSSAAARSIWSSTPHRQTRAGFCVFLRSGELLRLPEQNTPAIEGWAHNRTVRRCNQARRLTTGQKNLAAPQCRAVECFLLINAPNISGWWWCV